MNLPFSLLQRPNGLCWQSACGPATLRCCECCMLPRRGSSRGARPFKQLRSASPLLNAVCRLSACWHCRARPPSSRIATFVNKENRRRRRRATGAVSPPGGPSCVHGMYGIICMHAALAFYGTSFATLTYAQSGPLSHTTGWGHGRYTHCPLFSSVHAMLTCCQSSKNLNVSFLLWRFWVGAVSVSRQQSVAAALTDGVQQT